MFDLSALANDNGTNFGKLVLKPVDYNRSIYFRDKDSSDLLVLNPGLRSIDVGGELTEKGLILNTTSLFKAVSQFTGAVSMNTATVSGLNVLTTLTKNGSAVKVEETTPPIPVNFRIYDVFPTEDPTEKKGYVWLKWNYDQLVGTVDYTLETVVLPAANQVGETMNYSFGLAAGRKFRFSNGTEFTISVVSVSSGVYTITLDTTTQSLVEGTHVSSADFPSMIIDSDNVKGYTVKFGEFDINNADRINYQLIHKLDKTNRTNPQLIVKLELSKWWRIWVNSFNSDKESSFVGLPYGSYDPDHANGGQAPVTYQSPYNHTLPQISSQGSVALTSTSYGFNLNITGWEDETDTENTAHEFEVVYSIVDTGGFADYSTSTHLITKNRLVPISCNNPET